MFPLVRHAEHRRMPRPAPAGADVCARESAPGRRLAVGRFFTALWGTSTAGESTTRRSRRQLACRSRAVVLAGGVLTVPGCIETTEPSRLLQVTGYASPAAFQKVHFLRHAAEVLAA
jgi:hypothetical protein